MAVAFSIDAADGSILIGDARLEGRQSRMDIESRVSEWLRDSRDHGNGYAWLYLSGLRFGGCKAALSLCFQHGRLSQAGWNANLPDAVLEGGWPTREAIDEEIRFVRSVLAREIGFAPTEGNMAFDWGTVWSGFDAKGFLASNGLRYGTP